MELLRAAAGDGRLTLEELAERVEGALVAKTRGALEPLTADLPAPALAPSPPEGTRWTVSIMGGGDRKGRWRIAGALDASSTSSGGSDLDLRDALIDSNETVITVVSIMGGSTSSCPRASGEARRLRDPWAATTSRSRARDRGRSACRAASARTR